MTVPAPKADGVANPPAEVVPPVQDPAKAPESVKQDPPPEGKAETEVTPKPPEKSESKPAGALAAYELKAPENSLLSAAHIESLKAYAKDKGYSNDQAQALLERESIAAQASIETINQAAQVQSAKWLEEAKADKEIGGEKFAQSCEIASHALDVLFPGIEIRKFMDQTGFGNNPQILKGFVKIGKMLQPDKFNQAPGQMPPKRDTLKTMYDHPTSQQKN